MERKTKAEINTHECLLMRCGEVTERFHTDAISVLSPQGERKLCCALL